MAKFSKFLATVATVAVFSETTSAQNWQVRSSSRSNDDLQESIFAIDAQEIREFFANPSTNAARSAASPLVKLPLPSGDVGSFHVEFKPTSVMSKDLAERFPDIKTFEGVGVDALDGVTFVSAMYSESKGFYAQYLKPDGGLAYLDMSDRQMNGFPMAGEVELVSYDHRHVSKEDDDYECLAENEPKRMPSAEETREIFDESARRLQTERAFCRDEYADFVGNFRCEALLNTAECNYDGGDCCGGYSSKFECLEEEGMSCECIDPNHDLDILLKYRIAFATTVEYSIFHGNTTTSILPAVVVTLQRVNGVYKRELGVVMELINGTTDLFDLPGEPVRFINEANVINDSTQKFDELIGADTYDIGHVVSTGSGGVAYLGSVCNPDLKAGGTTGLGSPIGDPFDIDYVAHEVGHQFHGSHTFAGCSSNSGTPEFRYEPGSGTTIMAYAGICGPDNTQTNSDPMFHSASISEIKRFVNNPLTGGSCGQGLQEGFERPIIDPDFALPSSGAAAPVRECAVPQSTPFRLEAVNAPVDQSSFHYVWEQSEDSSEISNINGPQQTDTALFRSFTPKRFDASRTFPQLSSVVQGGQVLSERLPTLERSMGFALVVRSYYNGPGSAEEDLTLNQGVGTNYIGDFVYVDVQDSAVLPLVVAQPDAPLAFGESFEVSWTGGIAGDSVRVLLSLDGGDSFPFLLAEGLAIETGAATVQVPQGPGLKCNEDGFTQARIMVQSINEASPGCSYLNVNPSDIVVAECGVFPTAAPTPPTQSPTFITQAPTSGPPPPQVFQLNASSEPGYFADDKVFANLAEAQQYEIGPVYLPETDNSFVITAPEGNKVVLQFLVFATEADYDFVSVIEGADVDADPVKAFDGELVLPGDEPISVESEGNVLTIRFISDEAVEAPGFLATYSSVASASPADRRLADNNGEVSATVDVSSTFDRNGTMELDSFYETKAPANLAGKWLYSTTSGTLRFTFTKFDLGFGNGVVRIYDGKNDVATLLRVVTGVDVPTPVVSTGSSLFVTFEKIGDSPSRGFAATISLVDASFSPSPSPSPSSSSSSWLWFVGGGVVFLGCAGLVASKMHLINHRRANSSNNAQSDLEVGEAETSKGVEKTDSDLVAANPMFGN